jgi:hypothetical protein
MAKIRFIGLDVHAGTIAIAVAEPNGEVRSVGMIPNRPGIDSQSHGQARSSEAVEGLLRSRPDRVCFVLAVDPIGREL